MAVPKILSLCALLLSTSFIIPVFAQSQLGFEDIDPTQVRILRDQWGVPHIIGKTDAEVAYGLAWANAEDAFHIVQEALLTGKGMMGMHSGREGAIRDYILYAFDIPTIVHRQFDEVFSEEFKRYIDGYVQGINAYAKAHPREVLVAGTFPVTPQEALQGFLFITSYISYAPREVQRIVEGAFELDDSDAIGSNAYAFRSSLTDDGKTYLAINPHQPMEGPFSFYECHLTSEEGLNVHGAMFHGSMSVGLGNNENLGWAMTYNGLDLVDVFKLEMHPDRRGKYLFDGEYRKLVRKPLWLKVKLHSLLTVRIPKMVYWSVYGPTFKHKGEFYAIRFGAIQNIQVAEQLYRMNKAGNFEEFKEAMEMRGIPRFNIIYADREDNIYYVCNGQVPDRKEGYDWKEAVPGTGSETLWTDFLPYDQLPQVLNPECGFIYNTNNTPFHCTGPESNPDATDLDRYPLHAGYKSSDNNRSLRFMELVSDRESFDYEAFKAIKFDKQFPTHSPFLASCDELFCADPHDHPDLTQSLNLLQGWDRQADPASTEATLFALTIDKLFKEKDLGYDNFYTGFDVQPSELLNALDKAQQHLMHHFKKLEVPLSEFQRIVRGEIDLPLPGYFDVLAANYSQPVDNGQYEVFIGDSYTQFVVFSKDGVERLETLQPFGASSVEGSPHYTDQMELFVNHETKSMTMDPKEIERRARIEYHPMKDRKKGRR